MQMSYRRSFLSPPCGWSVVFKSSLSRKTHLTNVISFATIFSVIEYTRCEKYPSLTYFASLTYGETQISEIFEMCDVTKGTDTSARLVTMPPARCWLCLLNQTSGRYIKLSFIF